MSDRFTIVQGDALTLLRETPPNSVDAIITDPPYSSGGQYRGDRAAGSRDKYLTEGKHLPMFSGDNRDQRGFLTWMTMILTEGFRVLRPGEVVALFTDWRQLPTVTDAVQAAGFVWRGIAVWTKVNARPQKGRFSAANEFIVWGTKGPRPADGPCHPGAWQISPPRSCDRIHATQKPEELMREVVAIAPENGLVLDPFVGSGTTGVAALQTGRRFLGFELDGHAFKSAEARLIETERILGGGAPDPQQTTILEDIGHG